MSSFWPRLGLQFLWWGQTGLYAQVNFLLVARSLCWAQQHTHTKLKNRTLNHFDIVTSSQHWLLLSTPISDPEVLQDLTFRNAECCRFKCDHSSKHIPVSKGCIVPVTFKNNLLHMFPLYSHKNHAADYRKEAELWSCSRAVPEQPVKHGWRCRPLAQHHYHLLDKPGVAAGRASASPCLKGRQLLPRHVLPSPVLQTSPSHPAEPFPAPRRQRGHKGSSYTNLPSLPPGYGQVGQTASH